MRQYTVKFTIGFGNDWQSLPDTVTADNPHKAIEYAKYYLKTSEGVKDNELKSYRFIAELPIRPVNPYSRFNNPFYRGVRK